jgi:hypothetical protein
LLYGRPKFESRLGTPEEALYRAESNEDNKSGALRVVYIKILYVCSINVKKIKRVAACHQTFKKKKKKKKKKRVTLLPLSPQHLPNPLASISWHPRAILWEVFFRTHCSLQGGSDKSGILKIFLKISQHS